MAHSYFLQQMVARYQINIDDPGGKGKMLVCRRVLEGLEEWLKEDGHEKVLPAISVLQETLLELRNEFYIMRDGGELQKFWEKKFVTPEVVAHIEEAYTCAYSASAAYDNDDFYQASSHVTRCYHAIRQAKGVVLDK